MTTLTDSILLERTASGDSASFDTLFYRHYDRVYGVLFRLVGTRVEAEDLTQEVFIKLHAHAFSGNRRGSDQNIAGWLYRVATNAGYNALRSRKRLWQRNVHLVATGEGALPTDDEIVRREEKMAVRRALSQLTERQAQLLILRQTGFSYAECAEICGVAPGSVGTLLARAAEAFREIYSTMDRGGEVE